MQSIEPLLDGFRRFRQQHFERHPEGFRALVEQGQSPQAVVVCCSDSRADPALLFGTGPGDLFVIRNVANLVPAYQPDAGACATGAALEFAVRDLRVPHAIVLGHAHCGGIGAALATLRGQPPERDLIGPWVAPASTACEAAVAAHGDDNRACAATAECCNVAHSLQRLRSYPWVAERVHAGELALHGLWFDLNSGALHAVDPDSGASRPLVS